jgi:hypothetical protein
MFFLITRCFSSELVLCSKIEKMAHLRGNFFLENGILRIKNEKNPQDYTSRINSWVFLTEEKKLTNALVTKCSQNQLKRKIGVSSKNLVKSQIFHYCYCIILYILYCVCGRGGSKNCCSYNTSSCATDLTNLPICRYFL